MLFGQRCQALLDIGVVGRRLLRPLLRIVAEVGRGRKSDDCDIEAVSKLLKIGLLDYAGVTAIAM